MKYFIIILLIVASLVGGYYYGRSSIKIEEISVTIYDTQTYRKEIPDTMWLDTTIYKWRDRYIVLEGDTIKTHDSVLIEVPINTYVFEEDSVYRAEVRGAEVIDFSIDVFQKHTTTTKTLIVEPPKFRVSVFSEALMFNNPDLNLFTIGAEAGCRFDKLEISGGVGISHNGNTFGKIGLSYNLFAF